ncbi:AIR synthase-related protein [archaeon]|nr:hypothetical protein [Nanoarchaeota archaeon]MBU4300913.1 hypothetical protein [Nanoarchaeota archaeon]MBU4451755.1 hypothetical protein [Nanoarchaeota archaeon]MCG2723260.1 AIR synthase-related protein [archaeon]
MAPKNSGIDYSSFVDYAALDPVKRMALELFGPTLAYPEQRLGIKIVPQTLGATAIAFDTRKMKNPNNILVGNIEGLGTKNKIPENMYKQVIFDKTKIANEFEIRDAFRKIGMDTSAMSVNDANGIGADVFAYLDMISVGNSSYLSDNEKIRCLLQGYRDAADENGFSIPQGETPELKGIVEADTVDLAGASFGVVDADRLITGYNIKEGDIIFTLESSGIHANGVSKARKICEMTKDGYFTETEDGSTIGEKLLNPTIIYQRSVREMQAREIELHFLQPITGHAWEKIARTKLPYDYEIHHVPNSADTEAMGVFNELVMLGKAYNKTVSPSERFNLTNRENYYVWNWGAGLVAIAPKESREDIIQSGEKYDTKVIELGIVKKGERRVIMPFKECGQKVVYKP